MKKKALIWGGTTVLFLSAIAFGTMQVLQPITSQEILLKANIEALTNIEGSTETCMPYCYTDRNYTCEIYFSGSSYYTCSMWRPK